MEDLDEARFGQGSLDPFHIALRLVFPTAKAHVDGKLAHGEALIEEEIPELRGGMALPLRADGKIENHHHPHETITRQHRRLSLLRPRPPVQAIRVVASAREDRVPAFPSRRTRQAISPSVPSMWRRASFLAPSPYRD